MSAGPGSSFHGKEGQQHEEINLIGTQANQFFTFSQTSPGFTVKFLLIHFFVWYSTYSFFAEKANLFFTFSQTSPGFTVKFLLIHFFVYSTVVCEYSFFAEKTKYGC
jgi:hypothetical protein